jgi:hypothetical protein
MLRADLSVAQIVDERLIGFVVWTLPARSGSRKQRDDVPVIA